MVKNKLLIYFIGGNYGWGSKYRIRYDGYLTPEKAAKEVESYFNLMKKYDYTFSGNWEYRKDESGVRYNTKITKYTAKSGGFLERIAPKSGVGFRILKIERKPFPPLKKKTLFDEVLELFGLVNKK